jgi:succinoglycan biosynthesis transport protein ExoP
MVYLPDSTPRPAQRRPSLRAVPAIDRLAPQAPPLLTPPAAANDGLLETLRKLWRWKRMIFLFAVAFGGISAMVVASLPSYYTAEARVLVGVQMPRVFNAESIITDVSPDAERVADEGFVLQSRILAQQVIAKLGLVEDPDFNPALRKPSEWARLLEMRHLVPGWTEDILKWLPAQSDKPMPAAPTGDQRDARLVDLLLGRVDVSLLGRSHVLSVKADARNPSMAANIANTLAERYLDNQRQEKVAAMDKVDRFLTGRVAELREQVRKSDSAVEDYRRSHGLYKSSTTGVTAQQLAELNTQLIVAQTAKAEAEARLKEAQEVSKGGLSGRESVPEVLRSPLIASLKQQQADAERRAAEVSATYGPKHPLMANARAEVGSVQAKVTAEVGKTIDGLAREARAADARYQALNQNFERLKSTMGKVNEESIQLDALEREATVNRNLLDAMLNRVKQSTGAEDILQANAKLVSPAAPPAAPSYPPKALIVFLGTLGGLLVGSAVALMREGGDLTFRRADQIESTTGLPVLAMMPQISGRTPPAMEVLRHPTSPYSEALRRLQIGVELSRAAASPKKILFSSAVPSEGKSIMVASLGRLLASNGKRVLLIDCDWRSPKLHQIFRCNNKDGLAELLGEKTEVVIDEIIHHDALSGVDVLSCGRWSPRSAHLLSSQRMHHLVDALAPHYDFVILDTAPALVTADVLALSRLVDKVVFVVRWGHTRQDAAIEALRQIIDAQGDLAGVVLSRVVSREYRQYGYRDPFFEYARPMRLSLS